MSDIQVNTTTSSNQTAPKVAMDGDGDYVVVWQSAGQDGNLYGVFLQRYNADGTPVGGEVLVNTYTSGNQNNPAVAMNAQGEFVVTWDSSGQDGSGIGTFGQVFNADGTASGAEFQVNTYTSSSQSLSSVAMDDDGGFVVVWGSNGQDGNGYGVFGQRFDSTGTKQGAEFQVNTYTSSTQGVAKVAMDSDGDFVVVWHSSGQDGSSNGVHAQRYNASGVTQGSEFRVNTYSSGSQQNPSIAMADNGDFVIAWHSNGQDGSSNGIFAQRYNAAGVAQGAEFLVNTYTSGAQAQASVSMNSTGDFVIAWQSNLQDGSGYGVFAQAYQANGTAIGGEFQVNTYTSGSQSLSSVALGDDGDAVFAWASTGGQDGNSTGVFMASTSSLTCFLRGTLIATDRGEVAVEDLAEGNLVATRFGGLRPIRWIGLQCFDGRIAGPECHPVRLRAGSLGDGAPHSDLLVSPGHAMLVDNVLAHAGVLVNDATILREAATGLIEYFHLDLGAHDCVLANGAWAESYFEDRNRDSFHNAAEFHARFPGHVAERQATCLPIVDAGHPDATRAHARLAPRLVPDQLSPDADLHLLCDGRRVELERPATGVFTASVPAGTRELRLRSRGTRPSMAFGSDDHRRLGVMVLGVEAEGDGGLRSIALDDPALARGFHAPESEGGAVWRWTDGDAVIPLHILGESGAALRLSLRCATLAANFVGADAPVVLRAAA
jgi:hypothetical protein